MVLQKNTLLISRAERTKLGPYTLGTLQQGDFSEVPLAKKLKTMLFNYKKQKLAERQKEIQDKLDEASRIEQFSKNVQKIEQQTKDIKKLNSEVFKKKYPALAK